MAALGRSKPNLLYLTALDVIELTPNVGLIGDDGWADARLGNYEHSLVMMNDYRLIAELAPLTKQLRWPKLKELGDLAAQSHSPRASASTRQIPTRDSRHTCAATT